jgi:hypothetical protein
VLTRCRFRLSFAIFATLLATSPTFGQDTSEARQTDWNVPDRVRSAFDAAHISDKYDISHAINPFYLRGDFDGDGVPDYAVLLVNKSTKKRGIAIVHGRTKQADVLGAGGIVLWAGSKSKGYALEDFDWMDTWWVQRKLRKLEADEFNRSPGVMRGEAIDAEKSESGGGLIYWDGRQYRCFITGD